MASQKSKKIMKSKYEEKRNQIWLPMTNIADNHRVLWEQKDKKGFTNIPKAMPLILNLMDYLASKNKQSPVRDTYLALWCRDYGTGYVEIKDIDELASEAGFSGSRATTTLSTRIKTLSKEADNNLGFIRTQKSPSKKYKSILLLNPFLIIYLHYVDGKIPKPKYDELFNRCTDIGDKNLKVIQEGGEKYLTEIPSFIDSLKDT